MRRFIITIVAISLLIISFTGCTNQKRIEELEQQIADLQKAQESTTHEPSTTATITLMPSPTHNPNPQEGFISLGCSEDEVKKIMGTPDTLGRTMWWYGLSYISFDINDKVDGWSNNGNLKVN